MTCPVSIQGGYRGISDLRGRSRFLGRSPERKERKMSLRRLVLLALFAAVPAMRLAAQTIPPVPGLPDAFPSKAQRESTDPPGDGLRTLKKAGPDNLRQARELIRKGLIEKAGQALRKNADAVRPSERVAEDPREINVGLSLLEYLDGNLRGAFDRAQEVHGAGESGDVNIEAAILKSLIFIRVGLDPLALRWARWVKEFEPDNPAAASILKAFADVGAGTYTRDTTEHPAYPAYQIDGWQGSDARRQPLVLVLRKDLDFRGALAFQRLSSEGQNTSGYELKFYDLEARPFLVSYYEDPPGGAEFKAIDSPYNPQFGRGRYTIMRAELESFYWRREGVTPFAAWWAEYAGGTKNELVARHVQGPLEAEHAWSWQEKGTLTLGSKLDKRFFVLAFANADLLDAERLKKIDGPLEHYHFAVGSRETGQHLLSLVVTSTEPLPGERLYFLQRRSGGKLREEGMFSGLDPPEYRECTPRVKMLLGADVDEDELVPYPFSFSDPPNKRYARSYRDRGVAHAKKGEYDKAIDDYNEAIRIDPKYTSAYNSLAWLLATCPDAKYRDGNRAVVNATRACELTDWSKATYVDTLAAAYAERGDFDKAAEWQREATELVDDAEKADYTSRVELYKKGKPHRQSPPDGPSGTDR